MPCCQAHHNWGSWTLYEGSAVRPTDGGCYRYWRECLWMGCTTKQYVEDVGPIGKMWETE